MKRWAWVLVVVLAGCGTDGAGGGGKDDGGQADTGRQEDGTGPADVASGDPGDAVAADSGDAAQPDGRTVCTEGQRGCLDDAMVSVCVDGVFQFNAQCSEGTVCKDGYCTKEGDCTPGEVAGCDGMGSEWFCLPDGKTLASHPCQGGKKCVSGNCADVQCAPGFGMCVTSNTYRTCLPDGSGYGEPVDCEIGKTCVGGMCMSLCEADIKQNTNVGCLYWAVDLDNDKTHNPAFPSQPTPEMFPHSVVIGNPGGSDVVMTFSIRTTCADGSQCSPGLKTCNGKEDTVCDTAGDKEYELEFDDPVVPAGSSREFKMPVMNVTGSSLTSKAIRVMASQPVVAYQFNPFNSENATSNDGSLLLPQNALGKTYYAVSLPSRGAIMTFPENNGFLTVVATAPDTTVGITPTAKVIANPAQGVPMDGTTPAVLPPGKTQVFTLQPFDVLNLEQLAETEVITPGKIPVDLTGTRIQADKPVVVFSGHQVAGIQEALKIQMTDVWDSCCTEHMEEQLMPLETWGTEALCVKSKPRGYEADRFVIVAGDPNIQLTTVPPIDGVNGKTLEKPGDHLRIETTDSFILKATGRIQVVQFLMSQGQTQPIGGEPGTGDPSMMIIPPSSQYRDEYVIRTGDGYGTNWTTVIRPAGVPVTLDGSAIPDGQFESLGDGTWEFAYVEVTTGPHAFAADEAFGLMVYGYGGVTAYGYPGGMKLEQ